MIRALGTAIKVIVLAVLFATVLVTISILGSIAVIIYGFKIALWPGKRGIASILLERVLQSERLSDE